MLRHARLCASDLEPLVVHRPQHSGRPFELTGQLLGAQHERAVALDLLQKCQEIGISDLAVRTTVAVLDVAQLGYAKRRIEWDIADLLYIYTV